ncbi:hypothetical protein EYF80_012434 [Liparis tanakae]|uniref:Uncharacterized protein n=1 Tax=Liparis tanakae TaxID=230148 RepID=A0A4Z2IH90_9TELE|nr:hypothetical protein EYF80_012434 [Liparis tanakae]
MAGGGATEAGGRPIRQEASRKSGTSCCVQAHYRSSAVTPHFHFVVDILNLPFVTTSNRQVSKGSSKEYFRNFLGGVADL